MPLKFVQLLSRIFLQALQKSGNITKLEDILKEEVDPGIPEIKHFMYKSKTTAQFLTSCDKSYEDLEKKKRLKNIYFVLKKRLLSLNRPAKLLYFSGSHESAIAWVRQIFENLSRIFFSFFYISLIFFFRLRSILKSMQLLIQSRRKMMRLQLPTNWSNGQKKKKVIYSFYHHQLFRFLSKEMLNVLSNDKINVDFYIWICLKNSSNCVNAFFTFCFPEKLSNRN